MADFVLAVRVCCVTFDVAISIYIEGSKAILSLGPSFPVLFVTDCLASHSELRMYTQGYSFVAQSSLSARRDWREKKTGIMSALPQHRRAKLQQSRHSMEASYSLRISASKYKTGGPDDKFWDEDVERRLWKKKEMTAKWHCLTVLLHANCKLICALDTRGQKDAWILVIYSFRSRRLFL